ncbi:MAG: phospholipase D-like domain-containing protein [candidate division WOR-3 bacterium]
MARRQRKKLEGILGWITLFVLLAVIASFLSPLGKRVYYQLGREKGVSGPFWEIYFTSQTKPELRLVELIHGAKREAHLAYYELDNPDVITALLSRNKEIEIKVITETNNSDSWGVSRLRDAGVPVKTDDRNPLMHNKFAVIDDSLVWTGSYNLTERGAKLNYDNVIILFSPALARNYEAEFSEMWDGRFGAGSPRNTDCCFRIDSVEIENYFAPEDGVRGHLISEISLARREIRFMVYSFTDKAMAEALIKKQGEGVAVEGILNRDQIKDENSVWTKLSEAGVPVYFPKERTLHHKVMIIDSSVVITGSFNFTKSANTKNDENILIIRSPDIARAYLEEYERVKEKSGPAEIAGR